MGYSADAIETSGPIVISKDRVAELFADLLSRPADQFLGDRRWSWTQSFDTYPQTAEGLLSLLTDYGFYGDVDEDGDVSLSDWGGDKLGSSAEDVWNTLAKYATSDVRWIFSGEDGEMWADCIEGGRHVTRSVSVTVDDS